MGWGWGIMGFPSKSILLDSLRSAGSKLLSRRLQLIAYSSFTFGEGEKKGETTKRGRDEDSFMTRLEGGVSCLGCFIYAIGIPRKEDWFPLKAFDLSNQFFSLSLL